MHVLLWLNDAPWFLVFCKLEKWISAKYHGQGWFVLFVSEWSDQKSRFQSLITSHKCFHSSIQLLPYATYSVEKNVYLGHFFPKT